MSIAVSRTAPPLLLTRSRYRTLVLAHHTSWEAPAGLRTISLQAGVPIPLSTNRRLPGFPCPPAMQ